MLPSADNLLRLLKHVRPEEFPADTQRILQDISLTCHQCQAYSSIPVSFQVSMPEHIVFNQEVRIDLMWIDGNAALNIMDTGTTFSAAPVLSGQDVATVWNMFLEAWTTLYIGHPQSMLTDQGSVFLAAEWRNGCELPIISLRHTGTESHYSIGIGERFMDH
jgi:hypothetical protein